MCTQRGVGWCFKVLNLACRGKAANTNSQIMVGERASLLRAGSCSMCLHPEQKGSNISALRYSRNIAPAARFEGFGARTKLSDLGRGGKIGSGGPGDGNAIAEGRPWKDEGTKLYRGGGTLHCDLQAPVQPFSHAVKQVNTCSM